MGVCSFGNETKKNSIIILSDEDEKNKIFYPKNEFYYTIYSNHNKNSYDKISIFLTGILTEFALQPINLPTDKIQV